MMDRWCKVHWSRTERCQPEFKFEGQIFCFINFLAIKNTYGGLIDVAMTDGPITSNRQRIVASWAVSNQECASWTPRQMTLRVLPCEFAQEPRLFITVWILVAVFLLILPSIHSFLLNLLDQLLGDATLSVHHHPSFVTFFLAQQGIHFNTNRVNIALHLVKLPFLHIQIHFQGFFAIDQSFETLKKQFTGINNVFLLEFWI